MALFILKPVFWNTEGYVRPSGIRANKGYPAEHGYGHEEWNNAPLLAFSEDGTDHRAFHTEGVGNAPVSSEAGAIFVLMYASHDGVQELVGVAGSATCLIDDERQRRHLADRLSLDGLSKDVWSVARVRTLYGNDKIRFLRAWRSDVAWIPNWRCPAESFLWLQKPAPLDAQAIRGTEKLLTMFGRYTRLSLAEALLVMESVPLSQRLPAWHRIYADMEGPEADAVFAVVSEIKKRRDITETTRQRLVDARLGQGRFRTEVERRWGKACAVSGCSVRAVVRASHIKAWAKCGDAERLDSANGLLLSAELDALFDRGLISFDKNGAMLISSQLSPSDRMLLRLPRALRSPLDRDQLRYMSHHRARFGYGA
jgi:hypothetical protein